MRLVAAHTTYHRTMTEAARRYEEAEWRPNPDEVRVPEGRIHRRLSELIAAAATRALGATKEVDSSLNWYPNDGGTAMAPDVMVLPVGAATLDPDEPDVGIRSYRQDLTNGPPPDAVVEIPSPGDPYVTVLTKMRRYQRLGAVSYVVLPYPGIPQATRLVPGDPVDHAWLGTPCPELGGIAFVVHEGRLAVRTHDGLIAPYDANLATVVEAARQEAEAARHEAEAARHEAEARVAALEARLRDAGIDPESVS